MQIVLLTALGVGGATVIGSVIGFFFRNISHRFNDLILAFASGVMLSAAVTGLILESLEYTGKLTPIITVAGIFSGAAVIHLFDKIVPHMHRLAGIRDGETITKSEQLYKVLLFVSAIAIHNFPEGIAAGVSFGTGNISDAMTVALAIALQNVPEGMIIIAPMLSAGVSPRRTFITAAFTGVIEVIGTLIGYFAITISTAILPFALAFAGGTMLYVISDEMIPETHAHGNSRGVTYSLLLGFCIMLILDFYI